MPHLRRTLTGAVLVAALIVPATQAEAAKVKLSGGETTLAFNAKTAQALNALGVSIKTVKGAKATKDGQALFPITGGRVDLGTGVGRITHKGGLAISSAKTTVIADELEINTVSDKLSVNVGGTRLNAFKLDTKRSKIVRDGGSRQISNVVVKLAKGGARAFNGAFETDAFKRGTVIGIATVDINPSEILLTDGSTDLTLDPAAASALSSLGVTAGVADGATANPDGTIGFPITGGRLSVDSYAGRIVHTGALTLTQGATVVNLSAFTVNTKSSSLSGLVNGQGPTYLLHLGKAQEVAATGDSVELRGIEVTLSGPASRALNAAFNTTAFTPGLVLGKVTTSIEIV